MVHGSSAADIMLLFRSKEPQTLRSPATRSQRFANKREKWQRSDWQKWWVNEQKFFLAIDIFHCPIIFSFLGFNADFQMLQNITWLYRFSNNWPLIDLTNFKFKNTCVNAEMLSCPVCSIHITEARDQWWRSPSALGRCDVRVYCH